MGARQQLNRLHFAGDIALATVAGILVHSWTAFFLALAVLVGLDLHTRAIRPRRLARQAELEQKQQTVRRKGNEE